MIKLMSSIKCSIEDDDEDDVDQQFVESPWPPRGQLWTRAKFDICKLLFVSRVHFLICFSCEWAPLARGLFSRASENDYGAQPTQDPCVNTSWEIQLRNTVQKYSWKMQARMIMVHPGYPGSSCVHKLRIQLRNRVEKYSCQIQLRNIVETYSWKM